MSCIYLIEFKTRTITAGATKLFACPLCPLCPLWLRPYSQVNWFIKNSPPANLSWTSKNKKLGEIWFKWLLMLCYETSGTDGYHLMYLVQKCLDVYSCQATILTVILYVAMHISHRRIIDSLKWLLIASTSAIDISRVLKKLVHSRGKVCSYLNPHIKSKIPHFAT